MLRLEFERDLPVAAAAAWPHLTEPALMCSWSTAPVESVALGDGDHPGGVGALRLVRLPGRPRIVLEEVIEHSEAPRRLEYRVFRGAPVRSHRGTLELSDRAGGCHLRWVAAIDAGLPGLERMAALRLRPALEASLDRLVARLANGAGGGAAAGAAGAAGTTLPPVRALDESAELPALRAAAAPCAAEQSRLAGELLAAGDDRGWFARVYQYVTERMLADEAAGRFSHPAWLLRLIPPFHRLYVENLCRRLGRMPGEVEAHWRRAFIATERQRDRRRRGLEAAVVGIYAGMRAHIEHDLPRALCEVYVKHYAERCDYARFRADYLRMADVFVAAGDRLLGDIPRGAWPVRARLLDRLTPPGLRGRVIERRIYPIGSRRREAFERGLALVSMTHALTAA